MNCLDDKCCIISIFSWILCDPAGPVPCLHHTLSQRFELDSTSKRTSVNTTQHSSTCAHAAPIKTCSCLIAALGIKGSKSVLKYRLGP